MTDRPETFGPTRGFSPMADSMEPCKMLLADPCCQGNDIWAYNSACMGDIPEMFAPTGGFRGWPIQWDHAKCCGADLCCHGNIWPRHGDLVTYTACFVCRLVTEMLVAVLNVCGDEVYVLCVVKWCWLLCWTCVVMKSMFCVSSSDRDAVCCSERVWWWSLCFVCRLVTEMLVAVLSVCGDEVYVLCVV